MAYYYLNKMNNTYNQYKYQYLDHMETTIDIRQNYWQFATSLFCINDFKLPPGCLVANLDIPYQEVKDISFFLATDQSRAKEAVKFNKNYSHIYESKFNVDISSNEFLKQDLNNTKINCSIKLEIDPQVIKNAGVQLDQEPLDTLITETAEQRWDFAMYYSNTQIVKNNAIVNNINGYKLDKGNECSSKTSLISVSSNLYSQNNDAINNLVSIRSNVYFQIIQAKVKFYYWLEEETECKNLEANLTIDRSLTNEIEINFDQATRYDFVNNKVILDNGGVNGFYIPKYSHGYYEVELMLNQSNNLTKFIIKNDYVFLNNINNPHIVVSKTRIENIDDFKKVKWNG